MICRVNAVGARNLSLSNHLCTAMFLKRLGCQAPTDHQVEVKIFFKDA